MKLLVAVEIQTDETGTLCGDECEWFDRDYCRLFGRWMPGEIGDDDPSRVRCDECKDAQARLARETG